MFSLKAANWLAVLVLCAGPLFSTPARAACDKVVALSLKADYMVLEPEGLAAVEVGSLSWLGAYSAFYVAPGSSYEHAMLKSLTFQDVETKAFMFPREFRRQPMTLLYLRNLGRELASQQEIRFMQLFEPGPYMSVLWSPWLREGTLLVEHFDRDAPDGQSRLIRQMDTDLNVLNQWRPELSALRWPMCQKDGNLYFARLDSALEFREGDFSVIGFNALRNENYRVVSTTHTKNCKALAYNREDRTEPANYFLIDFTTGDIESRFTARRYARRILHADGNRLLLQELRRVASDPPRPAIPLNRFQSFDTRTGELLADKTLETGSGELHTAEMFCHRDKPVALIKDERAFYFIDPESLEIVARKVVPKAWLDYQVFQ